MKSLINPLILKKLKRDWNSKDKSDKFKDKVKIKLTKLGAKGTESPLFCKHEHCLWWQLKHYLIKQKAKEEAKKALIRKKEEKDLGWFYLKS